MIRPGLIAACAALLACSSAPPSPTVAGSREAIMFVHGPAGQLRVSDGGQGSAVPVVFVHGLGSNWMVWREQLDHFRKTRRAIAYDQRAHGESDPPTDGDYRIQSMAADLHAVVTTLGIERFYLVGHSMAGAVLSAYQGRYPDTLAGVVYVDAVGDMTQLPRDSVAAIEKRESSPDYGSKELVADYARMVSPKARPETRQAVLDAASRFSPRAFAAIRSNLVRYDPRLDVERYRGPKLAVEVEGNEFPGMASHLPGVKRETIPDVSHWLMLDNPRALDEKLDAFFAGR